MMLTLALLLAADPAGACAVETSSASRVVLSIDLEEGLGEDCAPIAALLSPPARALTSTDADEAARALRETTLFQGARCEAEGQTLRCALESTGVVREGEVTGDLPFVLLRPDVDRRLSLRSGVLVEDLEIAGRKQADRVAQYLVREGYFGSRARARWSEPERAGLMRAYELEVEVEAGESLLLRELRVRGAGDALTEADAREVLERYWILWFIQRRFRPLDFDDDLEALATRLRARFPEALVRGAWRVEGDAVDVEIDVELGPELVLELEGNVALDDEQIAERLSFDDARSLDAEEIERSAAAIAEAYQRLGHFEVSVSGAGRSEQPGQGRRDARASREIVRFVIDEGRRGHVREVTVTGTTAIDPELLARRAELWTQARLRPLRSGAYVDAWVDRDRRAIAEVLRGEGYGAPKVESELTIGAASDDLELTVRFIVDAGPQRTIGKLSIEGLPPELDAAEITRRLTLREGAPYVASAQTPDRRAILDALAAVAYPRAEIARKMKLPLADQPGEVSISYVVEPGARASFGGLFIRGALSTSAALIEATVGLEPGAPLTSAALSSAKRRLAELGVFGSIDARPLSLWREDRPSYVLVALEERARRELFAAISFSTDDYFAVGADYYDKNILGRAISLDLELRFANATELGTELKIGLRDRIKLRLGAPRPFGAPFDLEATAYYDLTRQAISVDRQLGGTFAVVRRLVDRGDCGACPALNASLGYDLRTTRLDLLASDERPSTIGRLFLLLVADRRDSVIDPRAGYQAELRVELANRAFAGPFSDDAKSFWRLLPSARGYLGLGAPLELRLDEGETIGGPFVLAGSLSYGVAHPYGSLDTGANALPRSETFAYGGDQSVRGLASGASRAGLASPAYVFVASGELRYYALQDFGFGTIQLAGFVDVGAVGDHVGDLFDAPTVSVGPAVRYVTPIGPLSFAYGWPLVRSADIVRGAPELIPETGRLHVTFGTSF